MYKDIETKRAKAREYYWKNREKSRAYRKKWEIENREKYLESRRQYREKNKERLLLEARERYHKVRKHLRKMDPKIKVDEKRWAKSRIARLKDYIQKAKIDKGGSCQRCRYDENPRILHFHHINGKKDKLGNISEMKSMKKIREEAAKCILLCPNCHAIEHLRDE